MHVLLLRRAHGGQAQADVQDARGGQCKCEQPTRPLDKPRAEQRAADAPKERRDIARNRRRLLGDKAAQCVEHARARGLGRLTQTLDDRRRDKERTSRVARAVMRPAREYHELAQHSDERALARAAQCQVRRERAHEAELVERYKWRVNEVTRQLGRLHREQFALGARRALAVGRARGERGVELGCGQAHAAHGGGDDIPVRRHGCCVARAPRRRQ